MPRNCPVGSPAAAGGCCLSSDGEQSADATVADARPADLDHCRPELLVRAAGRSLHRAEVLAQVANKRNGSVRLSAASRTLLGLLAVQPNVQLPDNVLQVAQAPSIQHQPPSCVACAHCQNRVQRLIELAPVPTCVRICLAAPSARRLLGRRGAGGITAGIGVAVSTGVCATNASATDSGAMGAGGTRRARRAARAGGRQERQERLLYTARARACPCLDRSPQHDPGRR